MILTGKAKEDFLKYAKEVHDDCGLGNNEKRLFYIQCIDSYKFIETEHYIENCGETMLNALIIEWFDSVGIIINVGGVLQNGIYSFSFDIQENNTLNGIDEYGFSNRQEATEKAIEKANDIYNETKA